MLYTRTQLKELDQEGHAMAIRRYLHKIEKKETGKLHPHECEYLGLRLRSIYKNDVDGITQILAWDPYNQEFLWEAVFKYLILLYFDNLDFLQPVKDARHELSIEEISRDKRIFDQYLAKWLALLNASKADRLIHEVRYEYLRKQKIIDKLRANGAYGLFLYKKKSLEQVLLAFYIYLTVQTFFRDLRLNYIEFVYDGNRFILNAYTYIHVISRHYIPQFNGVDTARSFNSNLPFVDPFNLPTSIAELLRNYFSQAPANYQLHPEYLIFGYKGDHYIVWWKYKRIEEINGQKAFEVRTLYKIESATDQDKIAGKTIIKNGDIEFYY